MNRRSLLQGAALAAAVFTIRPISVLAATGTDLAERLAALEARHGGRLGVAMLDMGSGQRSAYRGDERFLLCSTFKLLLVAAVLARIDSGDETAARRIVFDQSAVLAWAPVTGLNIGPPGMSVQELCEAAMIMSDNTAANLLLDTIGGPAGLTAYARSLGDDATRLDHREPLNNVSHGDEDTTTPAAMLASMQQVLLGNALSEVSRQKLLGWFVLNQTGAQALRAGLPSDWRVGDKTGSAAQASNDIAIAWPPGRKPVLISAYYMTDKGDSAQRKAVLAEVGQIVASSMA